MEDLSTAKKAVVEREIFCLLERGLAANLMSFVADLLGPEGLRRESPPAAATQVIFLTCFSFLSLLLVFVAGFGRQEGREACASSGLCREELYCSRGHLPFEPRVPGGDGAGRVSSAEADCATDAPSFCRCMMLSEAGVRLCLGGEQLRVSGERGWRRTRIRFVCLTVAGFSIDHAFPRGWSTVSTEAIPTRSRFLFLRHVFFGTVLYFSMYALLP